MPVSLIETAKRLLDQEKTLSREEQFARWRGRSDSAFAWYCECEKMLDHLRASSQLEMDVVIEATTPAEGGA